MFNKMKQLIMVVLATTTIGVSMVATNVFNPASTTVSARSIQANGPWETGDNGFDVLQHVSNGNEIYYSIAPGTKYHTYANAAAAAWNALGVINLIQVPYGDSRSQITIQYKNEYSDGDEDAQTDFNNASVDSNNNIDYLDETTITYYKNMNSDDKNEREIIAEHEFGHALGFDHDNRDLKNGKSYADYQLTMNADIDYYTYALGGIEQRTLAAHYGITPDQWLNTNC